MAVADNALGQRKSCCVQEQWIVDAVELCDVFAYHMRSLTYRAIHRLFRVAKHCEVVC